MEVPARLVIVYVLFQNLYAMEMPACLGFLLVIEFVLTATPPVPCPFKECTCYQTEISCSELHLITMPRTTLINNTYFTDVIFDRNNFTAVPSRSLPANLSSISFIEVPITTIDDDAFKESANTLSSLYFMYARFVQLPTAFRLLRSLNFLSITESSIEDWSPDALRGVSASLGTLALEQVVFKEWPSWLQLFTNLTDLSISGCRISSIPDNGLDAQIHTLTDLSLDDNSLTVVPKALFNLTALQLLALDKNKITDVQWLPQSSQLRSLSLNGNRLHDSNQLSDRLLAYAATLVEFDIQSNKLSSFPKLDFLIHVSSLDFVNNRLIDPNSGSLPVDLSDLKMRKNALPRIPRILSSLHKITEVYLGSNVITDLEGTAFPPLSRGVELENNLITEITDTSFPVNSSITYILLNNNPLVRVSDNAFVNLPHLVELQLQYTKLTRLPLALASLVKIDDFDISNTDDLVCTCLEKGLQDWIQLMRPEMVKGNCGVSSVVYFYTVLSAYCP